MLWTTILCNEHLKTFSLSLSRPQCHLSPLRPPSASLLAWSPTPPSSPAATVVASPPSVAAVCQRRRAPSYLQATTRPTRCLHPPPCQTQSPAVRMSLSAERTRHRPPIACTRGTTLAGLCRCPTVSPSPHRWTPQPCHPSLTSSAQEAWSWTEPPTLESPDQGLCRGRCPSYRCWFGSRAEARGRRWKKHTGVFCTFLLGTHLFVFFVIFSLAFLTYTPIKDTGL